MKLEEDIQSITSLKTRAPDLLDQINSTRRPIIITQSGRARGVLQDPESYEQMCRAMGLLKLMAQGEQDVREGRLTTQKEVFKSLRKKFFPLKAMANYLPY